MQRIVHVLFHATLSWNRGQLDGETKWLHISTTISDGKPSSVEADVMWLQSIAIPRSRAKSG